MHTSLKDMTEKAQKCDFSLNILILIEQTGFRSDILYKKSTLPDIAFFNLT